MSDLALPIGAVGLTLGAVGTILGGVAVEKSVANEKSIKDIRKSVYDQDLALDEALNDTEGNRLVMLDEKLDVMLFKKAPVIVDYQLPTEKGTSMQVLSMSEDGISTEFRTAAGTGTVVGPSSSTASHIALFADAGGVEIVEAPISVEIANGNMTGVGTINGVSLDTLDTDVGVLQTTVGTNVTDIAAFHLNQYTVTANVTAGTGTTGGTPPLGFTFQRIGEMVTVNVDPSALNFTTDYTPGAGTIIDVVVNLPVGSSAIWQPANTDDIVGGAISFAWGDNGTPADFLLFPVALRGFYASDLFDFSMQRAGNEAFNAGIPYAANTRWAIPAFSFTYKAAAIV